MASVSDITSTPLSGLNHIDALLDTGPDWNYLTPAGNTLYYTFSVVSGNEAGQTGQEAFTLNQQGAARAAFDYISKLTGIQFVETVNGANAQLHLCNTDLQAANITGLCSWRSSYTYSGTTLVSYDADAYIYLDDVEWFYQNHDLNPGGYGYETLLHELGHALGLKHPFDDSIHLPSSQDNTDTTLMSYTPTGAPHSAYSEYDIAALKWLYGMDGLGGALGINSATGARYIAGTSGADTLTGTAADDVLEGDGGNDTIDGGSGDDTAVFRGLRGNYDIIALANGDLLVTGRDGIDGSDTLHSIETLQFQDMSASGADIVAVAAEIAPTVKPALAAPLNSSPASDSVNFKVGATPPVMPAYAAPSLLGSNQVSFKGTAEAGSIIELVRGDGVPQTIAHTTTDASGAWHIDSAPLLNGNYTVSVTSSDLAGNRSTAATQATFTINSANNITGTSGADLLTPNAQNNAVDGGAGIDTARYAGSHKDFTVAQADWGFTVQDKLGGNGLDSLINVERIQFDDGYLAIDVDGKGLAGQLYRLYSASLGREPDAFGLGYWLARMEHGASLAQVSREFMVGADGTGQAEFARMYGDHSSNETFLTTLYHNILGREPDADGYQSWLTALNANPNADKLAFRAQVLIDFSNSPENQAKVELVGTLQHGVEYIPYHGA